MSCSNASGVGWTDTTEVASAKLAVLRTMKGAVEARGWTLLNDDEPEASEEDG
jgi:hypothetical protein